MSLIDLKVMKTLLTARLPPDCVNCANEVIYVVPFRGPVPYSGPRPYKRSKKDRYRAVDRYSGRSYRSKRPEYRFAVAVHSPVAVHGPITVQPEFFKFPRGNVPLGISLSTDFSAFSNFRRETCEFDISLSTDYPFLFKNKRKFGEGHLASSYGAWSCFFPFFFVRYRGLSFQKEKRLGLARDSLV